MIIGAKVQEFQFIYYEIKNTIDITTLEETLDSLASLQQMAQCVGEYIENYRDSKHVSVRLWKFIAKIFTKCMLRCWLEMTLTAMLQSWILLCVM